MMNAARINEGPTISATSIWLRLPPETGTGGTFMPKSKSIPAPLPTQLRQEIGTGGYFPLNYSRTPEEKCIVRNGPSSISSVLDLDNEDTATKDIERVRSILKLSTTDLAQALGVSRQAIYNWMSGTPISRDNRPKLIRLIKAADVIAASGKTLSPLQLDRTLPGGKTLLEKIAAGDDGAEAASSLLDMLRKEAHQRALIDQRLAEHDRPVRDTSDYGVPSFDEG